MHTSIPLCQIEARPRSALLLLAPRSLFFTIIALGGFAVSPPVKSQLPPPAPDGGYPGQNTAEGQTALHDLTSGTFNTAIGYQALANNTTGDANTGVGGNALIDNRSGTQNTAVGNAAMGVNETGSFNTAIGAGALFFSNADNNTATGYNALTSNRTGSQTRQTASTHSRTIQRPITTPQSVIRRWSTTRLEATIRPLAFSH